MNRKLLQQLFCVIFCNVCIVTFAQMSNDTTTLSGIFTYEQCVEYALRHNIQLKQSVLTRKSSEFDLEQAKAQWFPSLNFFINTELCKLSPPWRKCARKFLLGQLRPECRLGIA